MQIMLMEGRHEGEFFTKKAEKSRINEENKRHTCRSKKIKGQRGEIKDAASAGGKANA